MLPREVAGDATLGPAGSGDPADKDPGAAAPRTAAVVLFGFLLALSSFWHQRHFDSATPVSRLDLLHALVTHHRFRINGYDKNTPDKAIAGGDYYSDKAPGTAALALPPFALAAGLVRLAGVELDSPAGWRVSSWVACAGSQALPLALGGVALGVWLAGFVSRRVAWFTVLALFLGGMPLPYCTLLFSHAQVVGLLGVTVWGLDLFGEARPGAPRRPTGWPGRWRLALAGLCAGLALASEYTAGLVVMALGVYLLVRRRAGLGWFLLGAAPPLLLIPAYSWITMGSPFTLPYSHQASFPEMQEGLYAIKWPDAETAYKLLFSPARGLFFWSPFLVLAGFGYAALLRRSLGAFWLMYAVPLVQIAVISGRVWDWEAGFCFGPRYLAPMLPLLALPCALGWERWPRLGTLLAVYSVEVTTLATITDICSSYGVLDPLTESNIPKFLVGDFSYNLGTAVLGLPPYGSVGLYYALLIGGSIWLWRLTAPGGPAPTSTSAG